MIVQNVVAVLFTQGCFPAFLLETVGSEQSSGTTCTDEIMAFN